MTPTTKTLIFWTTETVLAICILDFLIGHPVSDFLKTYIFCENKTAIQLGETPLKIFIFGSINALIVAIGQKIIERRNT